MKKILGILVLGLLLSSNAYAVFYNFKDCVYRDSINKEQLNEVTIDLENKITNVQRTVYPAAWNNLKEPLFKNDVFKVDRVEDRQWFFFWKSEVIFEEIVPLHDTSQKKWLQRFYHTKDKSISVHLYWMDEATYDALPPKLKDIKNLAPWIESLSRAKLKEEKIGLRKSKFHCKAVKRYN